MVPQMIDTKLMTRETYTLYGIEGDFGNKDGKLTFTEKVKCIAVHKQAKQEKSRFFHYLASSNPA